VLPVKVIWDYAYYWGILAQIFFQGRVADIGALAALRGELAHCRRLNLAVQAFLRVWSSRSACRNRAGMLDQAMLGWFADLNRSLLDRLDDDGFRARLQQSTGQLRTLAREIVERAVADHPQLDAGVEGVALLAELAAGTQWGDWVNLARSADGAAEPMLFPAPFPAAVRAAVAT
jgi:hypothetical protein